ncbi:MAG: DivIVA domain-containing protein [Acidimicrobiia bacterium]|nr:DivIVA domain-containing protein [Acidimicrobiia bacterium]
MPTGFSRSRRGYNPAEVDQCLAEYEHAFRELEEHAARLAQELNDARAEIDRLRATEEQAVEGAMMAVFEAKDRILKDATEKARLIEEEARVNAGLPPQEQPPPAAAQRVIDVGAELVAELRAVEAETSGPSEPNEVLDQMLREADEIRNRLDDGLAAAFGEMEKMQKDAEDRARELLASARVEAARLRTSGEAPRPDIEVTIGSEAERPSRYSRQSAKLPRIGGDEEGSVLAAMANLRARIREGENDSGPQAASDAAS